MPFMGSTLLHKDEALSILPHTIQMLENAIQAGCSEKSAHWACRQARRAHLHVWNTRPDNAIVETLVDALRRFIVALGNNPATKDIRSNMSMRVTSLQSYLAGGPPLLTDEAFSDDPDIRALREQKRREMLAEASAKSAQNAIPKTGK
jgi:hypothetical protein